MLTFAKMLNNIASKIFPQLPEPSTEKILIAKFTDLIPAHLKIHLFSQKLKSYEEMSKLFFHMSGNFAVCTNACKFCGLTCLITPYTT